MTQMVGSARGKLLGVCEQEFYNHPEFYVIHAIKKTHRHGLCLGMRHACENKNLIYNQDRRGEIYKHGTDAKVETGCDCSSLIRQIIVEQVCPIPNCTTYNLKDECRKTGLFQVYKLRNKDELWNGDILVYRVNGKGHCLICTHGFKKNVEK